MDGASRRSWEELVLAGLPVAAAALDASGTVRWHNRAWGALGGTAGLPTGGLGEDLPESWAAAPATLGAPRIATGLRSVLGGRQDGFAETLRAPRDAPWRWLRIEVVRSPDAAGVIVSMVDVSSERSSGHDADAVLALSREMAAADDVEGLLDRLLDLVVRHLDCSTAATWIFDEDEECYRMSAQRGAPAELAEASGALRFPLGEPFRGRVAGGAGHGA